MSRWRWGGWEAGLENGKGDGPVPKIMNSIIGLIIGA
jgi:hypothetical protein